MNVSSVKYREMERDREKSGAVHWCDFTICFANNFTACKKACVQSFIRNLVPAYQANWRSVIGSNTLVQIFDAKVPIVSMGQKFMMEKNGRFLVSNESVWSVV